MSQVTVGALGRNSLYGVVAQVWRIGSRFVLTPLIIAQMGLEGYGVWTLLFTIFAYVTIIDTSFGVAYSKFTAEYDAKRDYRGLAQIIGSGMTLVGLAAVGGLSVLWLGHVPILRTLGVPQAMLSQASQALLLLSACVLMQMSIGCVFQVLPGLQRMDLQHKLGIVGSVVEFAVSIFLLYRGWELLGLAVGYVCGQVTSTVAPRTPSCSVARKTRFRRSRWYSPGPRTAGEYC